MHLVQCHILVTQIQLHHQLTLKSRVHVHSVLQLLLMHIMPHYYPWVHVSVSSSFPICRLY